jgi:hypothetical protein
MKCKNFSNKNYMFDLTIAVDRLMWCLGESLLVNQWVMRKLEDLHRWYCADKNVLF